MISCLESMSMARLSLVGESGCSWTSAVDCSGKRAHCSPTRNSAASTALTGDRSSQPVFSLIPIVFVFRLVLRRWR